MQAWAVRSERRQISRRRKQPHACFSTLEACSSRRMMLQGQSKMDIMSSKCDEQAYCDSAIAAHDRSSVSHANLRLCLPSHHHLLAADCVQ